MSHRDPYSRVDYRKLIAWPERIRREWPLIEEVFATAPRRRVLEVGCGPGQHARALADAGWEVVALDRSQAMIEAATAEPVPENLRFVLGDMTGLAREVDGPFGAALCLGNTLPHLVEKGDLRSFADGLARVLEPGAPLLLQILNYDRIHDRGVRALPVNVRPGAGRAEGSGGDGRTGAGEGPDEEIVFLRLMTPLSDGRVRFFPTTLTLCPGGEPAVRVERSKEVTLRGWRRGELAAILGDAGLAPERSLGGFDGSAFDPAASHDLVMVARRGS